MLLKGDNRVLIEDQPKTILTTSVAAAAVTLTVKSNGGFTQNNFVLIGKIGEEKTEIKRITAAVTAGTALTVAALIFAHDEDTLITKMDYDQIRFYQGTTTATGVAVALAAAQAIEPTEIYSYYEDNVNDTGYGFIRFYDSNGATYSAWSDAIPYTGYTANMLRSMRNKVRRLINETDELNSPIDNDEINDEINMTQKEVAHDRLWSFYEKTKSFSSVANRYEYSLATDVFTVFDAMFDTQPLAVIGVNRWSNLRWDTDRTGEPTHICVWRKKARVYPYSDSAADTTTLNGGITAADTTITVASTSDFRTQGKILIGSEVITYTGTTSTTFTGCIRGEEDTTAALALTGVTVTERNFIYHFQEEPSDLTNETDETLISEPSVITYKSAAELALRLDKEVLHDRLIAKYERAIVQLRKVDEPKIRMTFANVRNAEDVVSDYGISQDPNTPPTNINI